MIAPLRRLTATLATSLLVACSGTGEGPTRLYDGSARLRVAEAAETSGQGEVALSLFAAAAAAEPDRAEVQARFSAALARGGNIGQAEQVLTRALERRRDHPLLLAGLGRLRLRAGAAEQALEIFTQLIAAAPRDAAALDGQGVALDLLGRHAEAERSYRQAMALAPDSIAPKNNLAISLLLAGRAAEAVAVLEPLALRSGTQPRIATNLAIARAAAGDGGVSQNVGTGPDKANDLTVLLQSLAADVRSGLTGRHHQFPSAEVAM